MRSKAVQELLDKLNPIGDLREDYTNEELMPPRMDEWDGVKRECSCHINPPCQQCIDWSNCCDERMAVVEAKVEPGCVVFGHDCDVTRNRA